MVSNPEENNHGMIVFFSFTRSNVWQSNSVTVSNGINLRAFDVEFNKVRQKIQLNSGIETEVSVNKSEKQMTFT